MSTRIAIKISEKRRALKITYIFLKLTISFLYLSASQYETKTDM